MWFQRKKTGGYEEPVGLNQIFKEKKKENQKRMVFFFYFLRQNKGKGIQTSSNLRKL